MDKTTRCTHCSTEFTEEELMTAMDCPMCHSQGVPCQISEDVTVKINWHELRILGIWADNWAQTPGMNEESKHLIGKIIQRLECQHPSKTPLTLAGEIKKIQEDYPGASLLRGEKVVVKSRKAN